ncbi:hypothetical protein [Spirillospora sp. CA-128828]|uniref:hypothetical protein n=1 Tax=Spirillospora sp. CA-128828 TaxID=3240033 RepID=UPI003D8F9F39
MVYISPWAVGIVAVVLISSVVFGARRDGFEAAAGGGTGALIGGCGGIAFGGTLGALIGSVLFAFVGTVVASGGDVLRRKPRQR